MPTIGPPKLRIWLEPAIDDLRGPKEPYREEIRQLQESAEANGITLDFYRANPGQIFNFSVLHVIGQFAVAHLGQGITFLSSLLGSWLLARNGRKVRLKIGDIEAEAQSPKEVERLLEKAKEFQDRHQPKKIHES